jgi:hypothetical protein
MHQYWARPWSPDKIVEKHAFLQCYFCPEKYSRDHKCAAQGGVFCITMDAAVEGDDTINEDDLGISMHALSGVAPSDNIRLRVRNNGVELTALVDSGSTHTFIHDGVARRIGFDITHQPNLVVKVANGAQFHSPGICSATTIAMC